MSNKNQYIVLSNYGFSEDPYLILDYIYPNKKTYRDRFYIRDQVFSITKLSERFCVGRFDLSDFSSEPCPEKNRLLNRSNTCIECFKASGFNPAFYNVSENRISPQQQKYNKQPHNVYLAYFGSNTLKVGISHHDRTVIRWCEQGARAATIIKNCIDAYEARHIELSIGKGLNLRESFRGNQKRELINSPFIYNNAVIEINNICHRIEKVLDIKIQKNEIINLEKYFLGNKTLQENINDITDQEPLFIFGKCIGMIGDILIMEKSEKQFMISIKKFLSHAIEIKDEIKVYSLPFEQLSFL